MAYRPAGGPAAPTTSTFDAAAWGEAPLSGARHEAVLVEGVDRRT